MVQSNQVLRPISDHDSFDHLTNDYYRELVVHCYRILGSLQDAEDAVQECLLRAWRRLDTLNDLNALRAWLYRIATNVSLDMLDHRKTRLLPSQTHPPADPHDPLPGPSPEPMWLDPLPDTYFEFAGVSFTPEARYEVKESLTLAFLTLLQQLPGRQRVILILRDVLGWKAQEVADLLDLSIAATNSALQRARATLNKQTLHRSSPNSEEETSELLARYLTAWESADSDGLITLLREDAIFTMPPLPTWFKGRAAIKGFLDAFLFSGKMGRFPLAATSANGAPAFVVYQANSAGNYQPSALHVLTIAGKQIARIDDFIAFDSHLWSYFDPPPLD